MADSKKVQEKLRAQTEYGQKARVERHLVQNELTQRQNKKLRQIGRDIIKPVNDGHNTWDYVGSAAFHVYQAPTIGEVIFLTQTGPMQDVPEVTAAKGAQNFIQDLLESYGQKRQTKRSGF